jgi:Protein of unknown function (DUF2637)
MTWTRLARDSAAAIVAGIAAVASYTHMRDLAAAHGQTALIAALVPVSVDGMLVVSTVAMADDQAGGRRVRWSAYLAFTVGVLASIVANVLAAPPDIVSRCVSAWPSVALVLVVEVLARPGRAAKTDTVAHTNGHDPTARGRLTAARAANPDMPVTELARVAGVSVRHARRLLAEGANA